MRADLGVQAGCWAAAWSSETRERRSSQTQKRAVLPTCYRAEESVTFPPGAHWRAGTGESGCEGPSAAGPLETLPVGKPISPGHPAHRPFRKRIWLQHQSSVCGCAKGGKKRAFQKKCAVFCGKIMLMGAEWVEDREEHVCVWVCVCTSVYTCGRVCMHVGVRRV